MWTFVFHIFQFQSFFSLCPLKDIEEMNLRLGHLAMFLGDNDLAQEFYMSSSCPVAALEVGTYTQFEGNSV